MRKINQPPIPTNQHVAFDYFQRAHRIRVTSQRAQTFATLQRPNLNQRIIPATNQLGQLVHARAIQATRVTSEFHAHGVRLQVPNFYLILVLFIEACNQVLTARALV